METNLRNYFKSNDLIIEKLSVDEHLAQKMLSLSLGNRKFSKDNLLFLEKELKSGNFTYKNGESIKFNKNGNLIDGHHRLKAVVNTGITTTFLITKGVEREDTLDSGKKRSLKDKMDMSSNEILREQSDKAKTIVCYLRLNRGLNFSNTGWKNEIPLESIQTTLIEFSDLVNEITENYKKLKNPKKNPWYVGQYDKKETSIICSMILDLIVNYNIKKDVIFDFISKTFSLDSCEDNKLDKYRKFIIKDKIQTKGHRMSFNTFKDEFYKNIIQYNERKKVGC